MGTSGRLLFLVHGTHSPWPLPLSTAPSLEWQTGPFMGEKLGRCKSQVPRVWMPFLLSTASSGIWLHGWLLSQHSRDGGPWLGPGLNSVRLWWVSLSLNSHQKPSLTTHPFTLKGEEDKDRVLSKHTPHLLSVLCPAPRLAQLSLSRPVLRRDSLASSFPN